MDVLMIALALGFGAALGWILAARRWEQRLRDAEREGETARAGLEAYRESVAAQRTTEEQFGKRLEDAFANLSRTALAHNAEDFAKQAEGELDKRRTAIESMLKPFAEQLGKLEQGTREIEAKREKAYGALNEQLSKLSEQTVQLTQQSASLRTALRGSTHARGRWGELALHNIAELSGMTEHCDFEEQKAAADGSRPDMIVRLPDQGAIPVDAKVPLSAYLDALESDDPDVRAALMAKHAVALKQHVKALARRNYAEATGASVDVTVLFVPADPILAAAFESDPDLMADALSQRVLIATPVTLVALLRTVAIYWQQVSVAENAHHVWEEAREFHKRVVTFGKHLVRMGKGLRTALSGYDDAVGSFERNVLPQGRRVEELEDPSRRGPELPDLGAIEARPRELTPGARGAITEAAAGREPPTSADGDSDPDPTLFAGDESAGAPRSGYSIPADVRQATKSEDADVRRATKSEDAD